VADWSALPAAVALARESDEKILVEGALRGREIDVGVLEHPDGRILTSPPLEIRIADGHTFFDYSAKYQDSATIFDVPALDDDIAAALNETAARVFRVLGCAGLLRVDFFVSRAPDGRVVAAVNEVNTMPGMTAVSQFPRMWQAAGTPYPRLLDLLVETATRGTRSLSGAIAS
jgi:D-alanine-D-alanine ligase